MMSLELAMLDLTFLQKQVQAGVDIIIADKVGLIAKTLKLRYDGPWN